jgi:TRAP-type mannitol/chloroaromatic compound transport system permease large subunit
MKKELWFGFIIMGLIIGATLIFTPWSTLSMGHVGLLMLSLVVVAIMLGFPTAFTLMGMGVLFAFYAYVKKSGSTDEAIRQTLDLMVQRTWLVMTNDVLISIPLFVFMGYLVERANLIEKLFKSLHLALARVPGSLAVATLVTCAVFATATGIVGAVVTLMGLLAMPAMLRAGYSVKLTAGTITAGGCLGILIPPSVMLIVYGATAGVSVVQLYAGAFFPGIMLAGLYIVYVIIVAKLKPEWAPPLAESERKVALPEFAKQISEGISNKALPGLIGALKGKRNAGVETGTLASQLFVALLPAIVFTLFMGLIWHATTKPVEVASTEGLTEMSVDVSVEQKTTEVGGLEEPKAEGVQEPPKEEAPQPLGAQEPPAAEKTPPKVAETKAEKSAPKAAADQPRLPAPTWFWIFFGVNTAILVGFYAMFTFARLEIFKMLLASFFPLAVLILSVLGTIVFGLATPTEAAAIGSLGGYALAAVYAALNQPPEQARRILRVWLPFGLVIGVTALWVFLFKIGTTSVPLPSWLGVGTVAVIAVWLVLSYRQAKLHSVTQESVFLTAKTSAMVCWLFVGSSIFSAAFALLGGQEVVEKWVLSLGLSKLQFLLLSQFIIFILGWPLEWTEIIVIFMPIFIPLLDKFGVDPLFFGLLVALNLQTAFLSPPVAMAAFYLKGVAPPHVTLNQIFAGMIPFMGIQIFALFLLYVFPEIGLWLPQVLYK